MEPTFSSGEIAMFSRMFEPSAFVRGDLVVFSFEDEPDYFYVKRIVGLPGEKIHIRKDGLYVEKDGGEMKLEESYLEGDADSVPVSEAYRDNYQHTYDIPAGKYFVLGDNRAHSLDSRYFKNPFVKQTEIKGKYLFNITEL